MQAASDWQSAEAGCNDARGDMPTAGPLGNQHGYIVDVDGNINPILPRLITSDTHSRPFSCPDCEWEPHACMQGPFCMQSYLVAILGCVVA